MSQLKFMKIGVTVSAAIAKETVLSKLINMINVFRIDVANKPFDDVQKKYIDTILKLDDSKTIVLETKWEQITLKNISALSYQEWSQFTVEYSHIDEDSSSILFVNYSYLSEIPVWASIGFEWSDLVADVTYNYDGMITCMVKCSGTIEPKSKILFFGYKPKLSFLSEKDKKDIIWWIQSGVNLLAASAVRSSDDIIDMRNFLQHNNWEWIKIYTRLHHSDMLQELESIIKVSDGIVLNYEHIERAQWQYSMEALILLIKKYGKPVMICLSLEDIESEDIFKNNITTYIKRWIDLVMVEDNVTENKLPVETIQNLTNMFIDAEMSNCYEPVCDRFTYIIDNHIYEANYMITLLPKIIEDIDAKVIICYTSTWVTAAKIASLKLSIPSIVFTKNDPVYRYNNLLWSVKWYRIWQTSTYSQFKQIGKEMIRMHFKGNISLDDKVIILSLLEPSSHGTLSQDSSIESMINGIEVYKFKNI